MVGDHAPTTNVFKEIDMNADKQLSREEVSEYLKKQMVAADGTEGGEDIKQMLAEHDKLVEEIFQHEDKDKNGFISHDEFSGPKHDELWFGCYCCSFKRVHFVKIYFALFFSPVVDFLLLLFCVYRLLNAIKNVFSNISFKKLRIINRSFEISNNCKLYALFAGMSYKRN